MLVPDIAALPMAKLALSSPMMALLAMANQKVVVKPSETVKMAVTSTPETCAALISTLTRPCICLRSMARAIRASCIRGMCVLKCMCNTEKPLLVCLISHLGVPR